MKYFENEYCYVKDELTRAEFILDNIYNELLHEHFIDKEKVEKAVEMVEEIHEKAKRFLRFFDPKIEEKYIERLNKL